MLTQTQRRRRAVSPASWKSGSFWMMIVFSKKICCCCCSGVAPPLTSMERWKALLAAVDFLPPCCWLTVPQPLCGTLKLFFPSNERNEISTNGHPYFVSSPTTNFNLPNNLFLFLGFTKYDGFLSNGGLLRKGNIKSILHVSLCLWIISF